MVEVKWTAQASVDLATIARGIATEAPVQARAFVRDVTTTVKQRIAVFPRSGRVAPKQAIQTCAKSKSGFTSFPGQ